MKNAIKLVLPCVLALHFSGYALESVFLQNIPVWKKPVIRCVHADTSMPRVNADQFCQALGRSAPELGRPDCRIEGEWERDSLIAKYLAWAGRNMDPRVKPIHLSARHPSVAEKLRKLDDDYLLLFSRNQDTTWVALFTGKSTEPQALAYQVESSFNAEGIAEQIGQTWFSATAERRLSAKEKAAAAIEPDVSFGETPTFDTWISLGGGWSQATIPLTPTSWYKGKKDQRIRYYRNTTDSLSGWNFLEDESPLISIRTGFTWQGFVGGELFALRTTHKMKIDNRDTIYQELDHWNFTRYEIGLTVHATIRKTLGEHWETQPHAFVGFHYSILQEDIALKSSVAEASAQYRNRIQFEPFYKGAIFGIGNRLLWKGFLALETRVGLNNRGRSLDKEEGAEDAAPEPTIIAGSTLDCFISASLEYHWLRRK